MLSRGTQWPDGKPVPDDWKAEAFTIRARAGQARIDVELVADKFIDWAKGNGVVKRDWHATWRNFVRSERGGQIVPFPRRLGAENGRVNPPSVMQAAVELAQDLNRRDAERVVGVQ